ncbi:hypothetical protein WOLCODRAFT_54316, partial [Wolfiporia cocos MD-104 SS10]
RQAAERELVRLLDMRLLPTIIVIYVLNYIDRVAVTSARLQGLEQDLNLTNIQYNTVIAILFASYAPFQIPSNMVIPRFLVVCDRLPQLTKTFAGIMVCCVFIGLPE